MPTTRVRRHWFPRRRWLVLGFALALLTPVLVSYAAMARQPSSLPLGVRSVEWLRANHGNWLVDEAEQVYYGRLHPPRQGGPALTTLPKVGLPTVPAAPTGTPAAGTASHATAQAVTPSALLPPAVKAVVAPALAGEGVWRPTGPDVSGGPPVLVTTFRPDPAYPGLVAYLAWFDHNRTQLAYYPGRYEPPRAAVRGSAKVPTGQRARLLASFNAGFVYTDGLNGSSDNGQTNEPLKKGLATLVGYPDGRVDIVIWRGGADAGPQYAFTRQSLPPIVWQDKLNPALYDSTQWGFTLGNAVRVWRTGVGIDRHGNLIFAAADGQTVESLARLLQHAGAVKAMQFDINPEWPSLITYRHQHGLVPQKIVPNTQQTATRYLVPENRDFFAVYRRTNSSPLGVPFK